MLRLIRCWGSFRGLGCLRGSGPWSWWMLCMRSLGLCSCTDSFVLFFFVYDILWNMYDIYVWYLCMVFMYEYGIIIYREGSYPFGLGWCLLKLYVFVFCTFAVKYQRYHDNKYQYYNEQNNYYFLQFFHTPLNFFNTFINNLQIVLYFFIWLQLNQLYFFNLLFYFLFCKQLLKISLFFLVKIFIFYFFY